MSMASSSVSAWIFDSNAWGTQSKGLTQFCRNPGLGIDSKCIKVCSSRGFNFCSFPMNLCRVPCGLGLETVVRSSEGINKSYRDTWRVKLLVVFCYTSWAWSLWIMALPMNLRPSQSSTGHAHVKIHTNSGLLPVTTEFFNFHCVFGQMILLMALSAL